VLTRPQKVTNEAVAEWVFDFFSASFGVLNVPLHVALWHHGRMPKRSIKRNADSSQTGGGIASAVAQDLELTVEQAEEGVKKAAHAAAVALGLSSGEKPAKPSSMKRSLTAKPTAPSRSLKRKPKR
jgi:hypothetical protein